MARKPPPKIPPLLASLSEPAGPALSQENLPAHPQGENHEIQNHDPSTAAPTPGVLHPPARQRDPTADAGPPRQGSEGQPRGVDGTPRQSEARQRPEPDSRRGAGDSAPATGFVFRAAPKERQRTAVPGRGNGVPPPSYAARVKTAARKTARTLFDGPAS